MKENELRIGIYVYLFGDVVTLTKDHLVYLFARNSVPEPITLTEEWLLKFGFENQSKYFYFNDPYRIEQMLNGEMCFRIRVNGSESHPIAIISKVHQLQNLYFEITGKEFEILKGV